MEGDSSWPSESELDEIRNKVAEMSGKNAKEVKVVISPYRICPLGAHIDHQGGAVLAMTINKGVLLGFVASGNSQVVLRSGQFEGEVRFSDQVCGCDQQLQKRKEKETDLNENGRAPSPILEKNDWGTYAKGALYALQQQGMKLTQGIKGMISGSECLDSSGLSSSAAVGVAYLLALESANGLTVLPDVNIELDRLIENEYLGLKNGILDQSAILLSSYGCLTWMNCKTKEHKLIEWPNLQSDRQIKEFKILVACSGLKQTLKTNPGYNHRVSECLEAAKFLLEASGKAELKPLLGNVKPEDYKTYKGKLLPNLAKRAEHFFSENRRVDEGLEAWRSGNLKLFGRLISESGQSSIDNYDCGCEPLIELYNILLTTRGVFGARFSGAGFRGCCFAFIDGNHAAEAVSFVNLEYAKVQKKFAKQLNSNAQVLICELGHHARVA
ncbi:hypothetical protein Sjap_023048 [Stephania japonica]|uniref:Galacturonokinase n=1 Tax=Stephania japonica TaxID=461633 RepID=A0AAP0EQ22_9MAGN